MYQVHTGFRDRRKTEYRTEKLGDRIGVGMR